MARDLEVRREGFVTQEKWNHPLDLGVPEYHRPRLKGRPLVYPRGNNVSHSVGLQEIGVLLQGG